MDEIELLVVKPQVFGIVNHELQIWRDTDEVSLVWIETVAI